MDGSPPGSSVHRISQARILESVANPFSRGYSQPRDQTRVLLHCRQILWVTVDLSYFNKLFLNLKDYPLVLPLHGVWIQSLAGQLRSSMPQGAAKKLKKKKKKKKRELEIPGGPVAKTSRSQRRDPGSIPGQGVRSHMLQLRLSMPQSKILHTAMKIDDLEGHS